MVKWVEKELDSIELGDERLKERCKKILGGFFDYHNNSINNSFKGWQEVKATYRFLANEKVSMDKVLMPHYETTCRRIVEDDIVLCVQDTATVDYSHRAQKVEGLGNLRHESDQGFLVHPTIAFNKNRLCLGILNAKVFTRE
jgi:hypothetical protein